MNKPHARRPLSEAAGTAKFSGPAFDLSKNLLEKTELERKLEESLLETYRKFGPIDKRAPEREPASASHAGKAKGPRPGSLAASRAARR